MLAAGGESVSRSSKSIQINEWLKFTFEWNMVMSNGISNLSAHQSFSGPNWRQHDCLYDKENIWPLCYHQSQRSHQTAGSQCPIWTGDYRSMSPGFYWKLWWWWCKQCSMLYLGCKKDLFKAVLFIFLFFLVRRCGYYRMTLHVT